MSETQSAILTRARSLWIVGVLAGMVVIAAMFAGWAANWADRSMRAGLLMQTRIVAQAITIEQVQSLSGTEADLENPTYQKLKKQLTALRATDPLCRFVYLMGRRETGAVFYMVDSEPVGSDDYSPPGEVYEEVTARCRGLFDTGVAFVEGPVSDRWGVWVTGLVPVCEPSSGKVIAILGMDIDAVDWRWDVAARAALPVGVMLVTLIGIGAVLFSMRQLGASPKPVLRRLMFPLALIILLLTSGAAGLLWQQQERRLVEHTAHLVGVVRREFLVDVHNQMAGLSMAALPVAVDGGVRAALQGGDVPGLLATWQPVFLALQRDNGVSDFSFLDKGRVCLLRLHAPEQKGDIVERYALLESERTGRMACGIDVAPSGILTLRAVQPVYDASGTRVGYVEVGKELDSILQARQASGIELAITILKTRLDRSQTEETFARKGQPAEWDRLSRSVIVYASHGRLPDACAAWLEHHSQDMRGDEGRPLITFEGKTWHLSTAPVSNGAGEPIGSLLIMQDVSHSKTSFSHMLAVGGSAGGVLVTLLLCFIYVLLRRTDAGIRAQQAELRTSEQHLSATLRSIGDGVIASDVAGMVVSLNDVAERLTGWTTAEATGRPVDEVFQLLGSDGARVAENPVGQVLRMGHSVELADSMSLVARDGSRRQIADSCAPIHDAGGEVFGAVLVFRDVTEDHRRREQLRESEEKLRLMFEHAVSAIAIYEIVLDEAGRPVDFIFLDANPAFETHTGWQAHKTIGRRASEVFPGEELDVLIDIYGGIMHTGRPQSFEHYSTKLDRHFSLHAYRIDAVRFATVFSDITVRKRAEEEVRRNEARLRRLVSILQYTVDDIPSFLDYALEQALELTGSKIGYIYHYDERSREFILNTWSRDVMPACAVANPQTRYDLDKTGIWGEAVRQRRPIVVNNFLEPHPLKKGYPEGHVPLTKFMTVPVFRGEEIVGVIGLGNKATDYVEADILQVSLLMEAVWKVTARKQAEDALRKSESRVRVITDSAQDAILMMDPEGGVSYWNPAAERIFGYTREEAMGRHMHDLIVPQRYQQLHQTAFELFRRTGEGAAVGKTVDLDAVRKDGREIPVQVSLSAIHMEDGWHSVAIVCDITERKRAENELRQTNVALEQATARANEMAVQAAMANIAKSQFLANMSHEIRTPLNGVIGMTGLLLDTELNDEQRHFALIVRNSGESLLALLNDILDFSKIEAGKLELERLDFDLRSLLDDFSAMMAVRAHEKGLEFLCATEPELPVLLRGDPGRLRQILTNLASNAIKFTHEGEIAVRVRLLMEGDEDVLLQFSVKDTGIGIPADKQDMLFDKFTQADASTTRQYGGTGLGLAISKELAERMDGEIGLNSAPGQGSEFWFTVRLGKQPDAEGSLPPPANIRGTHVLVVDDNATNREILVTQFNAWSMWAEESASASTGLEAIRRAYDAGYPFQVVVVDMQMPGMDGAALAKAVKADDAIKDTPLVLMTSIGQRGDAKRMEKLGFRAYLTKPVRRSELAGCLSMVLTDAPPGEEPRPIVTRHTVRELRRSVMRILLAEDNITNQQVAMGILKKMGLRTDAVANGIEAIKALEAIPYDLVLMDVQMPELDGFEAARQIRDPQSAVRNHAIPIIAMTAHALQGDRERCLEAGMNDYVSKPVSPQALHEALDKWLPQEPAGYLDPTAEPPVPVASVSREPRTFDREGMMTRLMGDEELAQAVVEGFLLDIPQQIAALRAALQDANTVHAERQAHTIKGAAANVGGEALRAIAAEMEKAAKAGNVDAAITLVTELEMAFDRLRVAMTQER